MARRCSPDLLQQGALPVGGSQFAPRDLLFVVDPQKKAVAALPLPRKGRDGGIPGRDVAGVGGNGYLLEPLWWVGMVTAVLVTPLGALSLIVSDVLANFILNEKLQRMGVLGCVLCIVGSTVIILHAPKKEMSSRSGAW